MIYEVSDTCWTPLYAREKEAAVQAGDYPDEDPCPYRDGGQGQGAGKRLNGEAGSQAASVVVTVRVWSPKLAMRSSRPPRASM